MCSICKLNFEFSNIRYSNDGKTIVCRECYVKFTKADNKTAKVRNEKTGHATLQLSDADRIRVMCVDCRYKFSIKKEPRTAPICPYCGKNRLTKYEDLTADKILNDASRDKNFY